MHPPQDRPNSCLLTQHLPNALSGEPLSFNPLQPCLPGGGQGLVVVGKEDEYSTSGLCSHRGGG